MSCSSQHMHGQWGIHEALPLRRQRDMKQSLVNCICTNSSLVPTSYQKKNRNLRFCEGCIVKNQDQTFVNEYETFVKRSRLSGQKNSEHEPSSSDMDDQEPQTSFCTVGDVHDCEPEINPSHFPLHNGSCDASMMTDAITFLNLDDPSLSMTIDQLSETHKMKLAHCLGISINSIVLQHANIVSASYKDTEYLSKLDLNEYYSQQPTVLKAFLSGLQGKGDNENECDIYAKAKLVESVVSYVTPVILPLHFREGLILYNLTNSKTGLEMISKCSPFPSYSTVKNWIQNLALSPSISRPQGDILIAIDNNQILKKKWSIKVDNKSYSTTVTMVVAFEQNKNGSLENDASLAPNNWKQKKLSDEKMELLKNYDIDKAIRKLQYEQHLHPFISERIAKVATEQTLVNNQWRDMVDDKVHNDLKKKTIKECSNCNFENKKTSRKCQSCHQSLAKAQDEENTPETATKVYHDMRIKVTNDSKDDFKIKNEKCITRTEYEQFGCLNATSCPQTFVLNPVNVNPNSYEAIVTCLLSIGKQAGIHKYGTGERSFVFVYCDGVPYNLINRIIPCTYRCSECKTLLYGKNQSNLHSHGDVDVSMTIGFDWVLVLPGGGHIEINMIKALVELLWPVCWKSTVILFNFRSELALHSARQVNDHHKGWTIFRLFRKALVDELLVPYVRQELEKSDASNSEKVDLSPARYFAFLASAEDPNYKFLADVAFEFCDALAMFRAGIRTGRADLIMAGRILFSKMWCGRRHPHYRELDVQDLIQYVQKPDELRQFVESSMSLNTTGVPFTAEAPDFRLEEVNRQTQHFMPQSPKDTDWEKVCLNFDTLMAIKSGLYHHKGMDESTSIWNPRKPQETEVEELAVRAMFRANAYLTSPKERREHVSISGEKLNPELVHFCELSRKKYKSFIEAVVSHNDADTRKPSAVKWMGCSPVFVTNAEVLENERLESKTILELKVNVEQQIQQILHPEMMHEWTQLWNSIVKSQTTKKQDYIDFCQELIQYNTDSIDDNEEKTPS